NGELIPPHRVRRSSFIRVFDVKWTSLVTDVVVIVVILLMHNRYNISHHSIPPSSYHLVIRLYPFLPSNIPTPSIKASYNQLLFEPCAAARKKTDSNGVSAVAVVVQNKHCPP